MTQRAICAQLFGALALAFSAIPAHAFTAKPIPNVNESVSLECTVTKEHPRPAKADPDPVYKINVYLGTNYESKAFETFDIRHTRRSGKVVDRTEQYNNADIWRTNGRLEWFWEGYRGNTKMRGAVRWNKAGGWRYYETVFGKNGKPAYEMTSDCYDNGNYG